MVSTKVEPFLSFFFNITHGYSLPTEEGIRQLGVSFHLTIQSGVTPDHVTG